MEYNFREIEKKWQQYWKDNQTYKVTEKEGKKKFYVLDMFPYPSGAGLHVGHPLGYIASDIYSRFKRLKGFNVLHPMGYDAYGLPAEQYAIQTGQHPAITTEKNINRYREQLDKIGFCYDWSREIRTCDPEYYKWTQWAFEKMFNSFYSYDEQKALPIETLTKIFETSGTEGLNVACSEELSFTADEWKKMSVKEQQKTLLNYRIAYLGDTMVNWCPQLGTVLANDEVSEGLSVRGGYPVEQKIMRQWCLRVSAYAQRLLDGLDTIDWSESLKETQRNWIGRSEGAEMKFKVVESDVEFTIFTTRADTIFGVTFMVLAPESDYVAQVTTPEQKKEVDAYLDINGLEVKEAIAKTKAFIQEKGLGRIKVNYRLRDAIFSRQRYWGEPFPVYYKDDMPYMLDESKLPLLLPEIDKFLPTEQGEPPLGRAKNWETEDHFPLELCTMPGFAGSSAYYLRYMDPHNNNALVSKEANEYWRNVDLYIGGTEHATGHLIYSRFWNKFLYDLGIVCEAEPFRKLVNQGMIQGRSNFVYRIKDTNTFVSYNLKKEYDTTPIHVDVNIVSNDILDIEAFKKWRPEFETAEFILEDGKYICGWAVEKMSKSML